jgi:hypothetical protein
MDWVSHSDGCEGFYHLGCNIVQCGKIKPTFRMNIRLHLQGQILSQARNQEALLVACSLLVSYQAYSSTLKMEAILRNCDSLLLRGGMALHRRRYNSSSTDFVSSPRADRTAGCNQRSRKWIPIRTNLQGLLNSAPVIWYPSSAFMLITAYIELEKHLINCAGTVLHRIVNNILLVFLYTG